MNKLRIYILGICLLGSVQSYAAVSGYQKYLSEKALENLRSLEASHMIYHVYENFIVPRICENSREIFGGKNKKSCRLLGHVPADLFQPLKGDPTGILYKAKSPYLRSMNPNFTGDTPDWGPSAPPGYQVNYVGCYKREKIRSNKNAECSLFFMILEATSNPKLAPILAVKGSSHSEDWNNNLFVGAPILREFATLFTTELFKQIKIGVIGSEEEKMPQDIHGLAQVLAQFFLRLSAKSYRIIFTGHSLGGALAQELARSVFIATRKDLSDPSSGPTVNAITWNGLSYTSMISRLKKGLSNKLDPIVKAGWKESDAYYLQNYQKVFDGRFLSAVNFHTADDLLTSVVNLSFLGSLLRDKSANGMIHAGDDILLLTKRTIQVGSIKGQKYAHSTATTLKDALYSMGLESDGKNFKSISVSEQRAQLLPRAESEEDLADYKQSGSYFIQNGLNSSGFEKDGSMNFDRTIVYNDVKKHQKRAEKLNKMIRDLEINVRQYGRLLGGEMSQLTQFLYQ